LYIFCPILFFSKKTKEAGMTHTITIETAPLPTADETNRRIEEAAYYSWLNRGRLAQAGDELNDWFEAEKEFRDSLKATQSPPKLSPSKTTVGKRKN
jgi:hypothetical protein